MATISPSAFSGEHRCGPHLFAEFLIVHPRESIPGEDFIGIEARLACDGAGCCRVIAGDHDHPDARRAALLDRADNTRTQGIGEANQAQEFEREIPLRLRPFRSRKRCPSHAQHAQTARCHVVDGALVHFGVAERGDGLRCALGRDDDAVGRLPNIRHRQQIGAQAVLMHQLPARVGRRTGGVKRLLHRIGRLLRAGQHPERHGVAARRGSLRDGHAVFGQGAGLIGA
jgi:hypothetical protein